MARPKGSKNKNPPIVKPIGESVSETLYSFIGANVKRIRTIKGMGQEQLGEASEVGRTSIANLERGKQRIPIHTLFLIAVALDTEIQDLIPTVAQVVLATEGQGVLPIDHTVFTEEELKWIYERVASGKKPHERFDD